MKLEVFNNIEFGKVRVVVDEVNNEPYFVGVEVAKILGYSNPTKAIISHVDVDDRKKEVIQAQSQNGMVVKTETNLINESGLYSLILRSKLESAKKFKKWVTSEVLPSIRKYGGYLTTKKIEEALLNPDTIIQLAKNLKDEQEKRRELEKKIDTEYKPKALFADSVAQSKSSILIGQFAKAISTDDFKIGQNKLFKWLREQGYLIDGGQRHNQPKQKYIDNGYFEVVERTVNNPDGSVRITITTKITGKGQVALTKKIKEHFKKENVAA